MQSVNVKYILNYPLTANTTIYLQLDMKENWILNIALFLLEGKG